MRKFNQIIINVLTYSEFEEIIKIVYGKEYDFVESENTYNDTDHQFEVKQGNFGIYEKEDMNKFLNSENQNIMAHLLLQDLANKGEIPEGNYLIKVSW